MLLTELLLHNVGVYHGKQVVDLRTAPGRPVVLVGGMNGCGKTTFLDSLQLVLYGHRARLSNRGSQGYEDFLRDSINRKAAPADGASISLTFSIDLDGETREYRVVRSWSAPSKKVKESLDVFVDGQWDKALSAGWNDHVEEILPLEIASLFFFDGEKIEALADSDRAATVIQTAIHSLLGISTLEQLRGDLLALQRRQVVPGENKALDQRVVDLVEDYERVQELLDDVAQRRGSTSQEFGLAVKQAQKARRAFESDGGALFERRAALESERSAAADRLEVVQQQLRVLAEGALPLVLVQAQLQEAISQAGREAEAQDASQLLALLEERDRWLLDQVPASSRSEISQALKDDRTTRSSAAEVEVLLGITPAALNELSAAPVRAEEQRARAAELLAESTRLAQQIDQLDRELAGVPAEDLIAKRQSALDEARQTVARLEGQLHVLDEDLDRLRRDRQSVKEQLGRAESERLKAAVLADDIQRVIRHSDRVRETLAELRGKLIARHISKIEIATLDSFRRLMRKEGLVADLRIDPETFAIQLISASDELIPASRLSAGERQLLAVALLWGLARVAGNRLPTVIDTPLGRLDSRHREHLVDRYFPNAGAQVLLLSTDEEIDKELVARLQPAISQAYLLEHDDKQHTTDVMPGYWWPLEVPDVA